MAKGPKTLNPADRARKEARKKELKKNKKQRQQVRSAAIECRDPQQIIAELEQLDGLEFSIDNYRQQSTSSRLASDIIYKEKRKRLKELFARILAHYEKEDSEKHTKLKALEAAYEARYKKAQRDFEAVKAAQQVRIEDVFLPPELSETDQNKGQKCPGAAGSHHHAADGPTASLSGQDGNMSQPAGEFRRTAPAAFAASRFLPSNQRKRLAHHQATMATGKHNPTDGRHSQSGPGRPSNVDRQAPQMASTSTTDSPSEPPPSKPAAIIESKPVIFIPKVTKFVPASVRSKLGSAKK